MTFNIVKANKEISFLNNEKLELVKQMELLKKDLNEAQEVIGNFMIEKESFEKQMNDLKDLHSKEVTDIQNKFKEQIDVLNKSLDSEKNSAGRKAANSIAAIGIEPDMVKVTPNELLSNGNSKSKYQYIDHKK